MTRSIFHIIKLLKVKKNLISISLLITINIILIQKYFNCSSSPELQNPPKTKFMYLIQTEQCLSDFFLQFEYVLNQTECHCDVIVSSYKAQCLNIQHKHIVYLNEPIISKTWATGRNLMYKIAKERDIPYLYYIFLDGDIQLSYNENIVPKSIMNKSPMRAFEQFLIEKKPGVGVTDYVNHHGASHIISKMQENCNIGVNSDLSNRTSTDSLYLTSVHFDACFNAFHYEIVDHILPYILDYDDTNWFMSQVYLISLVELKFRGQTVLFRPVVADNTRHSDYPKGIEKMAETWLDMVNNFEMPQEFQNINWLKQFKQNPTEYTENSLTMCFLPPHQDPFTLYSHFRLNWSV